MVSLYRTDFILSVVDQIKHLNLRINPYSPLMPPAKRAIEVLSGHEAPKKLRKQKIRRANLGGMMTAVHVTLLLITITGSVDVYMFNSFFQAEPILRFPGIYRRGIFAPPPHGR